MFDDELTVQEFGDIEKQVYKDHLRRKAILVRSLGELKLEKQDLDRQCKYLKQELTKLLAILKIKKIKVTKKQELESRARAIKCREIEENLLPTIERKIQRHKDNLERLDLDRAHRFRNKQEELREKKKAAFAEVAEIEARSGVISKSDRILIVVPDNSSSNLSSGLNLSQILDGITPQFISQMLSEHQDIKIALVINRPIYDVIRSYAAYFQDISWVALETAKEADFNDLLDILSSLIAKFPVPKANLRVVSNSFRVLDKIQGLGISAVRWTSKDSSLGSEAINDPNDIVPWINFPTSSKLYLEQAVRSDVGRKIISGFRQGGAIDIQYFGRYFKKNDPRSFGEDGVLTQAILRAKHNQYSENIIEGLAEIIKTFPKNTWVTCIPDKEGKPQRMRALLASLIKRQDLSDYQFADNFFLEFKDPSFSTKGLNAQKRREKLGEVLQRRSEITLAGSGVLLLDDVVTSGATLERGYECLLEMKADVVYCVAFASTVYN
jgi:predicted amidophosphoribosyltransferase